MSSSPYHWPPPYTRPSGAQIHTTLACTPDNIIANSHEHLSGVMDSHGCVWKVRLGYMHTTPSPHTQTHTQTHRHMHTHHTCTHTHVTSTLICSATATSGNPAPVSARTHSTPPCNRCACVCCVPVCVCVRACVCVCVRVRVYQFLHPAQLSMQTRCRRVATTITITTAIEAAKMLNGDGVCDNAGESEEFVCCE